ncbi:MAG: hypothetical protein BWX88_04043 [Planctomycetes bacterium ADurb.Bin126]|nr:MAG: hypothetical protein BWX88_04043 [Planctomycetes bacterium ADurb.Bin126]HOD82193.1 hypothetical protein [Phycisphaerae bacterium]HQL76075.1 hypothetical protein [Phycisphaerae bacterium]
MALFDFLRKRPTVETIAEDLSKTLIAVLRSQPADKTEVALESLLLGYSEIRCALMLRAKPSSRALFKSVHEAFCDRFSKDSNGISNRYGEQRCRAYFDLIEASGISMDSELGTKLPALFVQFVWGAEPNGAVIVGDVFQDIQLRAHCVDIWAGVAGGIAPILDRIEEISKPAL